MTEGLPFTDEDVARLIRAEQVEIAATELLIAVRRSIRRGTIPDRSVVDDAHLRLRDALNPSWPINSDWWPEGTDVED